MQHHLSQWQLRCVLGGFIVDLRAHIEIGAFSPIRQSDKLIIRFDTVRELDKVFQRRVFRREEFP